MKKGFKNSSPRLRKVFFYNLLLLCLSCNTNQVKKEHKNMPNQKEKTQEMNSLGLLGGTSWHSTIEFYSIINQSVNDHFGNNTNPPLLIYTLNQAKIHRFQRANQWDSIANILVDAALKLNKGGALAVMFCANTPHKVFDSVQAKLDFPIIHIADATAKAIQKEGVKKVLFLGTKYSMQETFITKRLEDNGIEVLVPKDQAVIDELHRIIIEELTYGKIIDSSKKYVMDVIENARIEGAEGVILGCTEFPLMIFPKDLDISVFNTTEIHAEAGVDFILNRE